MSVRGGGLRARFGRFVDSTRPGTMKPYQGLVAQANKAEQRIHELGDAELTAAAKALRGKKALTDKQRVELCALGREAALRTLDLRPFDVQLLGTLAMLAGNVVEMATGEGKTLVGALAAVGYVAGGKQVHMVSVNDYLARRDAEWMGPCYRMLGVSVGWVTQFSTPEQRRTAYAADVTYVSVSELGFDVLRDRLCTDVAELVVPEPGVAIVDEADSVLIDEAKVPLVLAGAVDQHASDRQIADIVAALKPGEHYEADEEGRNVYLTDAGADAVESALGGVDLYDPDNAGSTLAEVNVSLHAHALLHRDVDYLVRDGKVQLINSSRGRIAKLQRWPDGLQAAVELKESLSVSTSGEVLDSLTVQALMSRYPTVCGMTGTAAAVADQLEEFYKLKVRAAEPNTPCIRVDEPDRVYATAGEKDTAIVEHVAQTHESGRPILIGTLDVAESERLAERLEEKGLECVVLNARNDASEAAIVAEAGAYGAITVSTQMAGRGTDIRLGGAKNTEDHERVADAGGLYVIGTGRHTSSRLDNQLRGRAGRQGDPGGSVFFTSLEDELVEQYAPDTMLATEGEVGELGLMHGKRAPADIRHAQRVAEGVNMEIHRNTWKYNQLIAQQRDIIMKHRDRLLRTDLVATELRATCAERYAEFEEKVEESVLVEAARQIALYHLDICWTEHLDYLSHIRESIHLHALARANPIDEFHRVAIPAFHDIVPEAGKRTVDTFERAVITEDGLDTDDAGLKRPTATWTYMVHDNPFGSEAERTLKWVSELVRGKRRANHSE